MNLSDARPPDHHVTTTGATVRPPATIAEATLTAAGILASARAAGLQEPASVTIYAYATPEISLYVHHDDPAATWDALEAWATRHGTRDIRVEPATAHGAYAHAEFTRTGTRVRVCALITGNPHPAAATEGDTGPGDTGSEGTTL